MAVLIFVAISILVDSESILRSVEFSLNIFKENIFPSLFPFFVLSNILVKCGFVELIGTLFKGIMGRMFRIKGAAADAAAPHFSLFALCRFGVSARNALILLVDFFRPRSAAQIIPALLEALPVGLGLLTHDVFHDEGNSRIGQRRGGALLGRRSRSVVVALFVLTGLAGLQAERDAHVVPRSRIHARKSEGIQSAPDTSGSHGRPS